MAPDSINLMAVFSSVEVKLPILFIIIVINGHTIWIIVIAQNRENAPQLRLQDFDAFSLRQLLFLSGHFPEHDFFPLFVSAFLESMPVLQYGL